MSTTQNIETATNVVQAVVGQIAKYYGGPMGQAAASLLLGQPGLVASLTDLAAKLQDGTATASDVADALYDVAAVVTGIGVLAGVASPVLLTAVGVAGAVLFLRKTFGDSIIDRLVEINAPNVIANNVNQQSAISDVNAAIAAGLIDPRTLLPRIDPATNTATTAARNWVPPRRDPLVLDLNGGGITTSAINPNAPILFDHDGDGIKTATGWIASGEAIVVRDLNGNGRIDSGRELFGDNTILTRGPNVGKTAANGFEALADLDSNADGKFDARDTAFASVKLWKDVNQDGISQSGELFSFAALGVQSINVKGTASNVNLGGGNTQTFTGSFSKVGGTTGSTGTSQVGNLLLANNNFYRTFTDDPAITTQAKGLPQVQGSGLVRDLRPAMSLGTPQAGSLQSAVAAFSAATTREGQLALTDELLRKWANTSPSTVSSLYVYGLYEKDGNFVTCNDVGSYRLYLHVEGMEERGEFGGKVPTRAGYEFLSRLNVLEAFYGSKFVRLAVPPPPSTGLGGGGGGGGSSPISNGAYYEATIAAPLIELLNQAYEALRSSVYGALVMQTRLKPYLNAIQLTIDSQGVGFDCSAAFALVQTKAASDRLNAIADLIDLAKFANGTTTAVGWSVLGSMKAILDMAPLTTSIQSLLNANNAVLLGANDVGYTNGGSRATMLFGNAKGNVLSGGGANDAIEGFDGDDTIDGGAGADIMSGGRGNDTFKVDDIGDVVIENSGEGVDAVATLVDFTLGANVENLTLTGAASINGTGNTLNNVLIGNGAANVLTGNAGNDTLNGGAGADSLIGGVGNDTYCLGRGFGFDTITEYDSTAGNTDVARFDTGISASQLWFTKVGNNLDVSIIGTSDKFTIGNWYLGSQYHVEQFKTIDGKTLLDSKVQNLVNAMAAFSPPAVGQTTLAANYAAVLSPVIAANWQ